MPWPGSYDKTGTVRVHYFTFQQSLSQKFQFGISDWNQLTYGTRPQFITSNTRVPTSVTLSVIRTRLAHSRLTAIRKFN
jgi:hypothetical protein